MHTARFLDRETPDQQLNCHEARLAVALEVDQAARTLSVYPERRLNSANEMTGASMKPQSSPWDLLTNDEGNSILIRPEIY